MTTILPGRAALLDTVTFAPGAHQADSGQMCVMEAAAYITGEPWSDHPQCVSPVIAAFLRVVDKDGTKVEGCDSLTEADHARTRHDVLYPKTAPHKVLQVYVREVLP